MGFRIKAFALHLSSSAIVLSLVLGFLWCGWYRWPGWYLTQVGHVAAVMAVVDVVLGPLLTCVVANPRKSRHELTRDIGSIAVVQLAALVYGSFTLWQGRPLYYVYAVDQLQLVQASDISSAEWTRAQRENPQFAPGIWRRPVMVSAPLPESSKERSELTWSAVSRGQDIAQMPRYFRPLQSAALDIRRHALPLERSKAFDKAEKQRLAEQMASLHLPRDAVTIPVTSRSGKSMCAVLGSDGVSIISYLRAES